MEHLKASRKRHFFYVTYLTLLLSPFVASEDSSKLVYEPGHDSLKEWLLPQKVPVPKDNPISKEKIDLGKQLFFDTRLSSDGNMSCATCHNPLFGWSDGFKTAKGFRSVVLERASPTIINTAFNTLQMWDGRKKSLEDQAMGPMTSIDEMNMKLPELLSFLKNSKGYSQAFKVAFTDEAISEMTIAKAIASFERTVISNDSPFDRWVQGDNKAMNKQQVEGFKLFIDPEKGDCANCHSAPNFTDNGFHNIGLAQFGTKKPDLGRYVEKPLGMLKGAFKTPTLRDITLTAPYFHDGSATTLEEVLAHYNEGGKVKTNLSPNMKGINLSSKEQQAIIAFLKTLTTEQKPFLLPIIPL